MRSVPPGIYTEETVAEFYHKWLGLEEDVLKKLNIRKALLGI